MKKLRFSFSALVALFLFGILSTAVLAAPPNSVSKIESAPVGETGIKVTWAAVTGATGYNVWWDGTQVVTGGTDLFYEATGIMPGEKYKFEIEAVNADGPSKKVVIDAILGLNQNFEGKDTTPVERINSNQTGFGTADNSGNSAKSVVKSIKMMDNKGNEATHKTHGDYQNNTNSCASCHQTHTSSGKALLFKDGVQATCTSCHDGTLGFYDVFATGAGAGAGAGTFGGDPHDGNASSHMANGTVAVKAAPGGNKNATSGTWASDFTCASCHSPHGSFSDRLLKVDPNGMASTPAAQGGNLQENVGVFTGTSSSAAVSDTDVPAGKNASTVLKYVTVAVGENADPASPFYQDPNATDGKYALLVYYKESGSWKPGKLLNTGNTGLPALTAAQYNGDKGYVVFTNALTPSTITANLAKPYVMKFKFKNETDDVATGIEIKETNGIESGDGRGFCLACHTDYKGGGSTQQISKWDPNEKFYGHNTNDTNRACVSCHFSHGTDVSIMKDAKGKTVAELVDDPTSAYYGDEDEAIKYMVDKNVSSALKKYTNMTSCWACHNSSKAGQFINSPRDPNHPTGMPN